jgi:hypothetical protein
MARAAEDGLIYLMNLFMKAWGLWLSACPWTSGIPSVYSIDDYILISAWVVSAT